MSDCRALFLPQKPIAARQLTVWDSMLLSGVSPSVAVLFTHVFDVAKTRLQLQGERLARDAATKSPAVVGTADSASISRSSTIEKDPSKRTVKSNVVYRNSFDCIAKIYRYEGFTGLYKGITPAILREASKNCFRIGLYDPLMQVIHDDAKGPAPSWKRFFVGSLCGAIGAFSSNPFDILKARLQSQASKEIAVGYQYNYSGMWRGFVQVLQEHGIRGLYHGSNMSMARSVVASSVNLSSYSMLKERGIRYGFKDSFWLDSWAGLISAFFTVMAMNPLDVVRTRYYNQPFDDHGRVGRYYQSGVDTFIKLVRNEGFKALYKGFFSHWLRLGPHFMLTFAFLGVFRRAYIDMYDNRDIRSTFKSLDVDSLGTVEMSRLNQILGMHQNEGQQQRLSMPDFQSLTSFIRKVSSPEIAQQMALIKIQSRDMSDRQRQLEGALSEKKMDTDVSKCIATDPQLWRESASEDEAIWREKLCQAALRCWRRE